MAAQLDLTGQKFGRLTVIRRAGTTRWGGKPCATWYCQCECGTTVTVVQKRLPYRESIPRRQIIDACDKCRRPRCVICGEAASSMRSNTCGEEHAAEKRRRIQLDAYYRKCAADPEYNRKRHEQRKERAAHDPEYAQRFAYERARAAARKREQWKIDPDYREHSRVRRMEWYRNNSDQVQAKRRSRLDTMTSEQRERWLERTRMYGRAYRKRWREELKRNPERHQSYIDYMREYRRQRELKKLLAVGHELSRRKR